MEIQASRAKARTTPTGEPILLLDQNRAHWDQLLIHRGLAALERAEQLTARSPNTSRSDNSPNNESPTNHEGVISTGAQRSGEIRFSTANFNLTSIPNPTPNQGPYTLQAAIAACHARAATPEATDWPRIATLYTTLAQTTPSPIIELNRAVAVSMAQGPQAGLDIVDTLTNEPTLKNYHLLPSVRGDLLKKLNRHNEARTEFERAATLTRNTRERDLLIKRAKACAQP
jgi:predicted RNA polymerase sigma factor